MQLLEDFFGVDLAALAEFDLRGLDLLRDFLSDLRFQFPVSPTVLVVGLPAVVSTEAHLLFSVDYTSRSDGLVHLVAVVTVAFWELRPFGG